MSNSDAKKEVDGLAHKLFVIDKKSISTETDFKAFDARKGELMDRMYDIPKVQLLREYSEIQSRVTGLLLSYIQQNDDYQSTMNTVDIFGKYVVGNGYIVNAYLNHQVFTQARQKDYEHYRAAMTAFLANLTVTIRNLWNELGEFGGDNRQDVVARLVEEKMLGLDEQLEEVRRRIDSLPNEICQAVRAEQNQDQEPNQKPEPETGPEPEPEPEQDQDQHQVPDQKPASEPEPESEKSSAPRQFDPYDDIVDSDDESVRPLMDKSSEQEPERKKEDQNGNSLPSASSSGGSKKTTDGYESFHDGYEHQGPVFDEYRNHESHGSSSRPEENRHHYQQQRPIFRGIAPRGHYDRNVNGECAFCGRRHFSNSCGNVPNVEKRVWILRKDGKCEYCLNFHREQCRNRSLCDYCWKAGEERYHHKAICSKATNIFGRRF